MQGGIAPDPEAEQLAEIARLYYEEGLTQSQIGKRYGISHSTVSRLLQEVRQRGIVEIRIHYPLPRAYDLEKKLAERYGLQGVQVLASHGLSYAETLRRMGILGARALSGLLKDGVVLGISWGTAVAATVEAMTQHDLPSAMVVQMIGGIGSANPAIDGIELARRLGERLRCRYHYLHAPLVVPSPEVHAALVQEPGIATVLELARKASLALVGIGAVEPEHSSLIRAGFLSREEATEIVRQGAVGDVCARTFDLAGRECQTIINRRVIGVSLGDLHRVGYVVGVAGSEAKARAILGALRGRHVNFLITDSRAAAQVLELEREKTIGRNG
ncbi:MAG: sugar-binding transcriptional regulator [Anaerolineae bacterium]|nr:sugar-binding transcriptional regulator [Anaerolineae bacterium]